MKRNQVAHPTYVGVVPLERDLSTKEFSHQLHFLKRNDNTLDAFFNEIQSDESPNFAAARMMEKIQCTCKFENYNHLALADYIIRRGIELKNDTYVVYLVPLRLKNCITYKIKQRCFQERIKNRNKDQRATIKFPIDTSLMDLFETYKNRIPDILTSLS